MARRNQNNGRTVHAECIRWRGAALRAAALALSLSAATALAVPPANDDCPQATPISGSGLFNFDLTMATQSQVDLTPCGTFGGEITYDVWFCWMPDCDGVATFETCGQTGVDTMIAVYAGCTCPTPPPNAVTPIACNDDCGACSPQSCVQIPVLCDETYLIRVGTPAVAAGGPGALSITCTGTPCDEPEPPPCLTFLSANYTSLDDSDYCDNSNSQPEEVRRSLGLNGTPTDLTFQTRYGQVIACNTRLLGGVHSISGTADYTVDFMVNAGIGENWCVVVDTSRQGIITIHDDGEGDASACLTGVSGTLLSTTAQLVQGSLSLPTVALCDPYLHFSSSYDASYTFGAPTQSSEAIITGVGPQVVPLNFHWYGTVESEPKAFPFYGDGDSVGIRMGEGTNCINPDITTDVCTYPGDPARTQADDGHFVTVTCIPCVKDYCQDFNGEFREPQSPDAVHHWTTTGIELQPLSNPGSGGAPTPPPPPGQGNGYLRVASAPFGSGLQLHGPPKLRGKWDCFCGYLEFDIQIFNDGVAGAPNFFPSFKLVRDDGFTAPSGGATATGTFVSSTPVNESSGWVHVRVPLVPGLQPTTGLGAWTFTQPQDREWLLARVTDVILAGEFTIGANVIGYDNICLVENHDCTPPPPDMVGWWPFDEKAAPPHDIASQRPTEARPSPASLGGAPGFQNSPAPVPGMVEGALEFDGVDDYVAVPAVTTSATFTFITSDFTIDAWIKTSQSAGEQPMVDKRSTTSFGSPPVGYRLFLHNGYLALGLADKDLPGETIFQSSNTSAPMLADGAWHHVAGTVKRFSNALGPASVKLYADGAIVGQFNPAGKSGLVPNGQADLLIGGGHAIGSLLPTYFRGRIDEVEIFRRALTTAEIFAIYQSGCAGKCKDWCYVSPYQCVNASGGTITFKICNGASTPKTINWSIANGGTNPACTINTGLTFSQSSGSEPVAAFGCKTVSVSVTPPAGMTISDLACFTVTMSDPASGIIRTCQGGITLCCLPPWKWFVASTFASVAYGAGAPATTAQFTVENTGSASASIAYRIVANSTNPADLAPGISLDGLPPGTPVEGVANVAAGQQQAIAVQVLYTSFQGFVPEQLTLQVDPENDGAFVTATVIGLIAVPFEPLCPGELADDFESYPPGAICGSGGWEEWAGSSDVCGSVTPQQASDGENSIKIVGNVGGSTGLGDDTVHRLAASGGQWTLSAMTFVPDDATGLGYLVVLNTYDDPPGAPFSTYRWSVIVRFDASMDSVIAEPAVLGENTPLVRGQWAELRLEIDLDNDQVDCYYDGVQFVSNRSWVSGVSSGGQPLIQAVDLYGGEPSLNGTSGMYFDAIELRAAELCPPPDCNGNELPDDVEILEGLATDVDHNGVPDECDVAELVDVISANPPLDNPFVTGAQPFEDVLQTGTTAALTQGIGTAGTPAQDSVTYGSVSVTFSDTPSPPPSPANITVACNGSGPYPCPSVSSVAGSGAGPYTLTLSGAIPPRNCTTLTFAGTTAGQKLQYRSLPGDINMNGTTSATDLSALVLAVNNGQAALPANLPRYNVNRLSSVSATDIARLVALLNGVNTTQPWTSVTVAACP